MNLTPAAESFAILTACALCAVCLFLGWSLRARRAQQDRDAIVDDWQSRLGKETREKLALAKDNEKLSASIAAERTQREKFKEGAMTRSTEMRSIQEQLRGLNEDLQSVTRERNNLTHRVANIQGAVASANQRTRELETEFAKSREFYKGQLVSALELRQQQEKSLDSALKEKQAADGELEILGSETVALNNELANTQIRLKTLDVTEQQVIALEADNAQLKHDLAASAQAAAAREKEAEELAALRAQNAELAIQLSALHQAQEDPASNPKEQQELETSVDSDDISETLRVKLNDFQQRLAEMQQEHLSSADAAGAAAAKLPPFGIEKPAGNTDDLKKIVGVGKVFETMLHRLGVYYYQQIATFGPAELSRINSELNEFKGRIEHDNWVGQARHLHAEKYGGAVTQTGHL